MLLLASAPAIALSPLLSTPSRSEPGRTWVATSACRSPTAAAAPPGTSSGPGASACGSADSGNRSLAEELSLMPFFNAFLLFSDMAIQ